MKRLILGLVLGGLLVFGLIGGLRAASRTEPPSLPAGVTKEVVRWTFEGKEVSVAFYRPAMDADAPLVVVAHGFTRSKRNMAGWGAHLAAEGFVVAVPTQPTLANHAFNGRAIASPVDRFRGRRRVALMGFSMGGLTTLLAASHTPVDAWVGLDPVDDGSGRKAAERLKIACAVLRAEPEAWNRQGNAVALLRSLPESTMSLKVRGATHLDAEWPTDLLGQVVCGFVDEARQKLFRRYATAFLKVHLLQDSASQQILDGAAKDDRLEVGSH